MEFSHQCSAALDSSHQPPTLPAMTLQSMGIAQAPNHGKRIRDPSEALLKSSRRTDDQMGEEEDDGGGAGSGANSGRLLTRSTGMPLS